MVNNKTKKMFRSVRNLVAISLVGSLLFFCSAKENQPEEQHILVENEDGEEIVIVDNYQKPQEIEPVLTPVLKSLEARLNVASIEAGFSGGTLETNDDYIEYVSRTEDISHLLDQFVDDSGYIPPHRMDEATISVRGLEVLVLMHRKKHETN